MHRRDYFTSPFSSLDFWVAVYACGGDKCDSILALSFSRLQVYNCWWIGQQIGLIYVTFFLESLPKKCQKVPFSNTCIQKRPRLNFHFSKEPKDLVVKYTILQLRSFVRFSLFSKNYIVLFGLVRQVGPLANLMTFKGHTSKKRK